MPLLESSISFIAKKGLFLTPNMHNGLISRFSQKLPFEQLWSHLGQLLRVSGIAVQGSGFKEILVFIRDFSQFRHFGALLLRSQTQLENFSTDTINTFTCVEKCLLEYRKTFYIGGEKKLTLSEPIPPKRSKLTKIRKKLDF